MQKKFSDLCIFCNILTFFVTFCIAIFLQQLDSKNAFSYKILQEFL